MNTKSFIQKLKAKLFFVFYKIIQSPKILLYHLVSTTKIVGSPRRNQPVQAAGSGKIICEEGSFLGVSLSPYFFSTYCYLEARKKNSFILIKEGTWINNNFCAISEHTSITIGNNCLIGTNVEMLDSDFHGLAQNDRTSKPERAKAVIIEKNVFIGNNSKILKGVTIGYCSVIANNSVVTKNVLPLTIFGGNPAKFIKSIEEN
jgi:acetyltransferase-like isoleucine patch superfamily enzyme